MESSTLFRHIHERLSAAYPQGEARALARHVLEARFGMTLKDICLGQDCPISPKQRQDLENIVARLLQKEPVQYVLGQAGFCGRTFSVSPGVLIPRPETEELAEWIIREEKPRTCPPDILDIGTGSGCIAITLALELPEARVSATDISPQALETARKNAARMGASVDFRQEDILKASAECPPAPLWDVIVSNPPYICNREKIDMEENVLRHEPPQALFVPDDSPLLFYCAIGQYACRTLKPDGRLYVEINRAYGEETSSLFRELGLSDIILRKDLYENPRMIQCKKR